MIQYSYVETPYESTQKHVNVRHTLTSVYEMTQDELTCRLN